jgi:hypothetical protein
MTTGRINQVTISERSLLIRGLVNFHKASAAPLSTLFAFKYVTNFCDYSKRMFRKTLNCDCSANHTTCVGLSLTNRGLMLATNPVLLTLINFSAAPSPADR